MRDGNQRETKYPKQRYNLQLKSSTEEIWNNRNNGKCRQVAPKGNPRNYAELEKTTRSMADSKAGNTGAQAPEGIDKSRRTSGMEEQQRLGSRSRR